MNIFDVADDVKQEEERDVVAGQRLGTDIYKMKIKMVYLDKSVGGAHNINIVGTVNDSPYNETIYITNKKGENFYKDKKTGDKRMMPGFQQVSNMCELLIGKPLKSMTMEDKKIKVYNYDEQKEVPVDRKVLTELCGIVAHPAIVKILENKQIKGSDDKYVNDPTGAIREKNEITKWFDEDKKTLPEKKAKKEADFFNTWLKANKGKDRNKVEKVVGSTSASGAAETTEDLFGDD